MQNKKTILETTQLSRIEIMVGGLGWKTKDGETWMDGRNITSLGFAEAWLLRVVIQAGHGASIHWGWGYQYRLGRKDFKFDL